MITIYVIVIVIILILGILLIPIRLKIQYSEKEREELRLLNKIEIFVFYIFKVKTIKMKSKKNIEKKNNEYKTDAIYKLMNTYINYLKEKQMIMTKKKFKRIFDSMYYEKMNIGIGINFTDPIINAYIITLINIAINAFIMKNEKNINLHNTDYSTYISKNIFSLNLNLIVRIRLITIIYTLTKVIVRVIKLKNKTNKENRSKSLVSSN